MFLVTKSVFSGFSPRGGRGGGGRGGGGRGITLAFQLRLSQRKHFKASKSV